MFYKVAVSEQQGEFVYLDKIAEEPGLNKEDEEIGDIIDNTEVTGSGRRQSLSSLSEQTAGPLMGQVWRALHRRAQASPASSGARRLRRPGRRSSRCGTPSSVRSVRSHRSVSSTKSGTHQHHVPETSETTERPHEKDNSSTNVDTKDTFSSKL